ncbi:MAG: carboxyl-terminal processing protease [Flavobacteriales bacterium]|jgi:carboxyl-terminal processing protease
MQSFYKATISAAVVIFSLASSNGIAKAKEKFTYDKSQSATVIEVVENLNYRHINKQRLNDELSEAFLASLLDNIDPSKMYLYDADIKTFSKDKKKFDNYFKEGNLDVAFSIYNIYHRRVLSRLDSVIELLEDKTIEFDFSKNDTIQLDRENASWPKTTGAANDLWYKRIKLSILNLKLAGKTVVEAREVIAKRYKNQLNRIQQEQSGDAFEVLLNSLTGLYDPHTNYWLPKTSENFDINMSLSLEGIGAVLQPEDEFTKVVRLIPGGPADKQGQLSSADRIVGVAQGEDGEIIDIIGWRLDEVVQRIRGPKGTVVRLEVLPAGATVGASTKVIKINRGTVKLEDQSAQKAILELPDNNGALQKIGVIRLPNFYIDFEAASRRDPNYRSGTRDVARLLGELQEEGIDGLVFDLRNNGGGSLQEATMLTDLFIDRGVVVQIKTPDGRVHRDNQAFYRPQYTGPMVVLINRLSASASEIFAGAIQDYGRGLVIGSRSFGKGTVQSLKDLKLGKLKLTESKFYRVSGDSTQHRGVIPDIRFPSVIDFDEVGESAYETALPWDNIHPVQHVMYTDYAKVLPQLKLAHKKRISKDPDFIYLKEHITFTQENQKNTLISLNEKARIATKEALESKGLALENKRRMSKGLEPFPTREALIKEEEERSDIISADADAGANKINVDSDTLLMEAGNIILDLLSYLPAAKDSTIASRYK